MLTRRTLMIALPAAAIAGPAHAATGALPGGGRVTVPSGYRQMLPSDTYFEDGVKAMIAFKKWRTTMSGYPECDGMIAVSREADHRDLDSFCTNVRAMLTSQWAEAHERPETRFRDTPSQYFPIQRASGPAGAELWRALSVHRVGFFDVYDKPATQYARLDRKGVMIGVWIFESDGGLKRARKLANDIAGSYAR